MCSNRKWFFTFHLETALYFCSTEGWQTFNFFCLRNTTILKSNCGCLWRILISILAVTYLSGRQNFTLERFYLCLDDGQNFTVALVLCDFKMCLRLIFNVTLICARCFNHSRTYVWHKCGIAHFLNNSEQHLLGQYFVYCQNLFILHLNIGVKSFILSFILKFLLKVIIPKLNFSHVE